MFFVVFCIGSVLTVEFVGTRHRNEVWQDELTLWTDTVAQSPHNGRALMNLGVALMARGKYDLARYNFERAKLYTPRYSLLEVNFGVLDAATGDVPAAEFHFKQALFLDPTGRDSYTYYAAWLRKWGRTAEAENLLMLGGFK